MNAHVFLELGKRPLLLLSLCCCIHRLAFCEVIVHRCVVAGVVVDSESIEFILVLGFDGLLGLGVDFFNNGFVKYFSFLEFFPHIH